MMWKKEEMYICSPKCLTYFVKRFFFFFFFSRTALPDSGSLEHHTLKLH